jgi:hypothetical protein
MFAQLFHQEKLFLSMPGKDNVTGEMLRSVLFRECNSSMHTIYAHC